MHRNILSRSWSRPRFRRLAALSACGLALAAGITVGSPQRTIRPSAALQDGLRQIVRIRRQQVERYRQLRRRSSINNDQAAPTVALHAELLTAEARLASAEGQPRESQRKLREVASLWESHQAYLASSGAPAQAREHARIQREEAHYALHAARGEVEQARRNLSEIIQLRRAQVERLRRAPSGDDPANDLLDNAEVAYHEARIRLAQFELSAAAGSEQARATRSGTEGRTRSDTITSSGSRIIQNAPRNAADPAPINGGAAEPNTAPGESGPRASGPGASSSGASAPGNVPPANGAAPPLNEQQDG